MWPASVAPFDVHLVAAGKDDAVRATADRLYESLRDGVAVLYDDRDERPGVKFKDADLVGYPLRVTVGPRALERGAVELKHRRETEATELPVAEAASRIAALVRDGLAEA